MLISFWHCRGQLCHCDFFLSLKSVVQGIFLYRILGLGNECGYKQPSAKTECSVTLAGKYKLALISGTQVV